MEEFHLLTYPDERLREVCAEVKKFGEEFWRKVDALLERVREWRGVGLAAPQVGWNARVFVANTTGKPEDSLVFVNPQIEKQRGRVVADEGCLCFPGLSAEIPRSAWIRASAIGRDGKPFALEAEGLLARCIQHETDHLEGILLIDRMRDVDRLALEPELREMERRRDAERRDAAAAATTATA